MMQPTQLTGVLSLTPDTAAEHDKQSDKPGASPSQHSNLTKRRQGKHTSCTEIKKKFTLAAISAKLISPFTPEL